MSALLFRYNALQRFDDVIVNLLELRNDLEVPPASPNREGFKADYKAFEVCYKRNKGSCK
jgi:hypothetical protein